MKRQDTVKSFSESKSDLPETPKQVSAEKERFLASMTDLTRETTIDEINDILSLTIKKDEPTKAITFLSYLLTYTKDNQVNLCFKSESARGKSYIALEVAKYFPKEDVMKIGYASPTAFFHQKGIPIFTGDGENEERKFSHFEIDLSNKILIFLDQPNNHLLARLRPLLSHDEKEYWSFITDRSEKYGLRTKKVLIIGFPTVAFCTAKMNTDEQEATRVFILSPDASQEKLEESTRLVGLKEAHREEFKELLEKNEKRNWLKARVETVKDASIKNVDFTDETSIWKRFRDIHKNLKPRHQRDYARLLALIKAHALLNHFTREKIENPEKTIIANETDIDAGFKLYSQVYESNELGLAPEIYEIWKQVIEPTLKLVPEGAGIDKNDILKSYYAKYNRSLSPRRLKDIILPQLEGAGLIIQEKDPEDGRRKLVKIYPPQGVGSEENNIETPYPHPTGDISSYGDEVP